MRHVLHLIKDSVNRTALDVVVQQARDPDVRLSIVLLQHAANLRDRLPGEVFRLDEGSANGTPAPYPPITHSQLLDLIFAADTVVTW